MPIRAGSNTFQLVLLVFLGLIFVGLVASLPVDTKEGNRVVIIRSGTGLPQIARQLKTEGLIRSSSAFMVLALPYRRHLVAGEYTLSKSMSTLEIAQRVVRGFRNVYVLTIREGDNLYDIAQQAQKARIINATDFLLMAQDPALNVRLGIEGTTLEGYLAPDTYYYSREMDLQHFLGRIVRRTTALFTPRQIQDRLQALQLDMYQTLTLASMIEREAKASDEKPFISSVFHNRLAKRMSLDCDPTVVYGTGKFGLPITKKDLSTPTPYNTYRLRGLPRGPIANPDKTSIIAALYPAQTDYLYFVARDDGRHVFSKKMNEHNHYVMMYQRGKKTKQQ
jgi:UPF0755 protein